MFEAALAEKRITQYWATHTTAMVVGQIVSGMLVNGYWTNHDEMMAEATKLANEVYALARRSVTEEVDEDAK